MRTVKTLSSVINALKNWQNECHSEILPLKTWMSISGRTSVCVCDIKVAEIGIDTDNFFILSWNCTESAKKQFCREMLLCFQNQ